MSSYYGQKILLGIKITAEGSSRSPEKDKIRTTASKMVSNMVNKIREGESIYAQNVRTC